MRKYSEAQGFINESAVLGKEITDINQKEIIVSIVKLVMDPEEYKNKLGDKKLNELEVFTKDSVTFFITPKDDRGILATAVVNVK